MSITPEQLDEIEKLAEAAWPGPWRATPGTDWGHHDGPRAYTLEGANFHTLWSSGSGEYEHPDWGTACFITAMREHALPLVNALREARVERDEAYQERADWMHSLDRSKADIITLMRERDEARAEVERLRAASKRFVNQYPWQQGPEIQELKALKEDDR